MFISCLSCHGCVGSVGKECNGCDVTLVCPSGILSVVLSVGLSNVLQAWSKFKKLGHRRFCYSTLRLRSAIRRHHPPHRAVLSQICCFGERKPARLDYSSEFGLLR